ncbi:MAG TPA: glycosyltransferase, partial [Planctomycetota bacterium]|nr:glycosyltransferase [Planctomycetota bacterium]
VGLRALGADVTTFAPRAPNVMDPIDDAGGAVVRVGDASATAPFYGDGLEANLRGIASLRAASALLRYGRALRAEIAASGPFDAVIAHWLVPTAWWLAGKISAPLFGVCHGGDARVLSRPWIGAACARRLRGATAGVLAVSRGAAEVVARRLDLPAARLATAPMGVDASAFAPDAAAPEPRESDLVVAAGRLVPIKGFDVLVRACAGADVRLLILGEGPERDALTRLAAKLGVRLDLPGAVRRDATASAFRRAAVAVVPSRRTPDGREEGTPVVALEAACAGAAVIAAAVGGLPDVLPPASLVPPEAPDALRTLLKEALRRPEAFRIPGAAARFDRARTAEALTGLLRAGGIGPSRRG